MYALVLDGEVKSALTTVRALGRAGVRVTALSTRPSGMALHSRFAAARATYHSPIDDPQKFLDDIERSARALPELPVVYCMSDATMLLMSRNRARFASIVRMPLASAESVDIVADKEQTRALAESLEISVPPDAAGAYPVVVKPRHSAHWNTGKGTRGTVTFSFSKKDVVRRSQEIFEESGEEPLLQAFVRGGEFGFEALCHQGKILSFVAHKRIRSLSPTGGAAVVKVTIDPPREMLDASEKLFKALQWEGVAMVEFKQDDETGTYLLLEVNGRFWGSLPLALAAGVDFPNQYFALATGRTDVSTVVARVGVSTQHFLGDVRHLTRVWFSDDPMRALVYPSRARATLDFLRATLSMQGDVWDIRDPLPSLMEVVDKL